MNGITTNVQSGARSPLVNKSLEHTFGVKNLPSDQIGKVVQNEWMVEAMTQN